MEEKLSVASDSSPTLGTSCAIANSFSNQWKTLDDFNTEQPTHHLLSRFIAANMDPLVAVLAPGSSETKTWIHRTRFGFQ